MLKSLPLLKGFAAFIVAIVVLPTLYRANKISHTVAHVTGQDSTAFLEVIYNDAPLIITVLVLLVLTMLITSRWLACIPFAGAAMLQTALMADVAIFQQFSQRLTWADTVKFSDYLVSYLLDFDLGSVAVMIACLVVLPAILYVAFLSVRAVGFGLKRSSIVLVGLCAVCMLAWQSRDTGYVHYRLYQNFISYNRVIASEFQQYSDEFAATATPPFEDRCVAKPVISGPLIVYMVESLSSYQTAFFGGANDWMPVFDQIARDNMAFTNFYANGFTTEDGEISLLTAKLPLYPPNSFTTGGSTAFAGHWTSGQSLPRILRHRGYDTYFLTSGDLTFSSTGAWMERIGFENVEGSEHSIYDGLERFHFDSAGDGALVDHVLHTLEVATKTPFVFVKTVSSHHPHIHPETGERSVEAVMRYTDAQIGRLHDALAARGFFETGHLVIVGDHRAMLPITKGEVTRLGLDKAYTQIPAVIVGQEIAPGPGNKITAPFSQVDLSNTLIAYLGGEMCTSPAKGSIENGLAWPAKYIFHRRGDKRNQVSVFAGDRVGVITLNGDKTAFSGTAFNSDEQKRLVDYVNTTRIQADLAEQARDP